MISQTPTETNLQNLITNSASLLGLNCTRRCITSCMGLFHLTETTKQGTPEHPTGTTRSEVDGRVMVCLVKCRGRPFISGCETRTHMHTKTSSHVAHTHISHHHANHTDYTHVMYLHIKYVLRAHVSRETVDVVLTEPRGSSVIDHEDSIAQSSKTHWPHQEVGWYSRVRSTMRTHY